MGESVVQLSIRQDEYAELEMRHCNICDGIFPKCLVDNGRK
jgi:hypothetical protein